MPAGALWSIAFTRDPIVYVKCPKTVMIYEGALTAQLKPGNLTILKSYRFEPQGRLEDRAATRRCDC